VSSIFAGSYARLYDAMYASKDYSRECDFVEGALRRYGDGGTYRTVLDLGCGTGNHAILLAKRGYDVTGVDLSPDMVEVAKRKAADSGVSAGFRTGNMRDVDVGREFDAVLILFAALGYQIADVDVSATLANVRRHLRRGGVAILDVWNAPTAFGEGLQDRVGIVEQPGRQLIKTSMRTVDPSGAFVNVRVRVWDIRGTTVADAADETHRMRPFSQAELERALRSSALEPRAFVDFPDLDRRVTASTFDLGCIAIAT
jgi:SAM-dependent methyltransferase